MSSVEENVLQEIIKLLENDQLVLPTLPEVALQARDTANDENASANDLAKVINNDSAITARIIKVANSPIMRGTAEINDVKMAIARMGMTVISNLVTGLAMEQMFQATSDLIDTTMRKNWQHSTEVAGIANVLCRHYTKLKPDLATLGGLVHNIGVLPILAYAEDTNKLNDPITLERVIEKIHPQLGTKILTSWDFPKELINIPETYLNFERQKDDDKADYADIIMVANLQSYIGKEHPLTEFDWAQVTAFQRLGLDPNIEESEEEDLSEQMAAATAMLQS